jgi:hypothetical protein
MFGSCNLHNHLPKVQPGKEGFRRLKNPVLMISCFEGFFGFLSILLGFWPLLSVRDYLLAELSEEQRHWNSKPLITLQLIRITHQN